MTLEGSYLDVDGFAARVGPSRASLVYGDFIDPSGQWVDAKKIAARAAWTTFVQSKLQALTSWINSRLRKRYAAPFVDPIPEIVLGWLASLALPLLYLGRGVDASDKQFVDVKEEAATAREELKEAADAVDGLFELPVRQDLQTSAVDQGGPYSYSEPDAYAWLDAQALSVRGCQ